jgi:O-acetylhomoserine (thiol)-lyase
MIAFSIRGGIQAGKMFIESLDLIGHMANLGDSRTIVIHPASTTHSQLTPEQRAAAGVGEGLIRLSVGLEDISDIIEDLASALSAASAQDR